MSRHNFEVDDIRNIKLMSMKCSRCREEPKDVYALVFYAEDMLIIPGEERQDACAIFCQGTDGCDGQAWAFPVNKDDAIVRKHNALPPLHSNN